MVYFGMFLYALLGMLAVMFWLAVRGRSLADLLDQATHDHHHVHSVMGKQPIGGTWREHSRWMREEAGE